MLGLSRTRNQAVEGREFIGNRPNLRTSVSYEHTAVINSLRVAGASNSWISLLEK